MTAPIPRSPAIDQTIGDFLRRGRDAQIAVDKEVARTTSTDRELSRDNATHVGYCVWSPEHRGWWKQDGHGYVEDAWAAGVFSIERAVEIWTDSNYQDTPVPRAAAIALMAELHNFAMSGRRPATS